jgi:nitroimidazol reductase NimA-like FMN-containing flavoprotein (pyridoxamine 5'-phosphate oxidase superfamily)
VPRTNIDTEQATSVLRDGHLVRVAFRDGDATYLIPLGYAWVEAALYGVGERGRKTDLAAREPVVAFQVDTAIETGLFEWESVTGTGQFTVVSDQDEARAALAILQPLMAKAPDWWRADQAPRMAQGALIVWRITPSSFAGVRFAR